jgi:hypothetical protein
MTAWFRKKRRTADESIRKQVQDKLSMVSRRPELIDVSVSNGSVILRGPILEDEADYVTKIIRQVPGVQRLKNRLDVYSEDRDVSPAAETKPQSRGRSFLMGGLAMVGTGFIMKFLFRRRTPMQRSVQTER